jgi:hypothetical protein
MTIDPKITVEDTHVTDPSTGTRHKAVKVTLILTPEYVHLMHNLLKSKGNT